MDDDKGKKKKAESPLQGPDKKKARRYGDDASVSDAALASRDFAVALARARRNQAGLAAGGGSVPVFQNQMPVMPPPATAPVRPQPRPPSFQSGGDDLARIPSARYEQRPAAAASGSSASALRNQAGLAAGDGSVPGFQNQVRAPQATAPVWLQRRPPRLQSGGDDLARIPSAATINDLRQQPLGRPRLRHPSISVLVGFPRRPGMVMGGLLPAPLPPDMLIGGLLPAPRPPPAAAPLLGKLDAPLPAAPVAQALAPACHDAGASTELHLGPPGTEPRQSPQPEECPACRVKKGTMAAHPTPHRCLCQNCRVANAACPICAAAPSTKLQLGPPRTQPLRLPQPERCPACRVRNGAMAARPAPHRCLCQNCLAANATCPVCTAASRSGGA
ncbi:hypothetical protein ACP70R_025177 [Stipagrostis hirtigluma subsp. patula]